MPIPHHYSFPEKAIRPRIPEKAWAIGREAGAIRKFSFPSERKNSA
jgi:hypothetical protein